MPLRRKSLKHRAYRHGARQEQGRSFYSLLAPHPAIQARTAWNCTDLYMNGAPSLKLRGSEEEYNAGEVGRLFHDCQLTERLRSRALRRSTAPLQSRAAGARRSHR